MGKCTIRSERNFQTGIKGVLKADKGNVTVVMKNEEYHQLSLEMLEDPQSYKQLRGDPTSTLQQKANKLVTSLKNEHFIDEQTAKSLMLYSATSPKFYVLPKIHKPQLKLRPIISSIDCPNSRLSQFLTDILTKAYNVNNSYHIRNSTDFSRFIANITLPRDFVIISLDVVSLFTNIPIDLVNNSIENRWDDIKNHSDIPKEQFLKLTDFVFDSTYFSYDNKFYKQITGTPMGAIISPILAQYVMDDFLDQCISKLSFEMPFCKKYVDDIICSVPKTAIQEVLTVFNSLHTKIQFTIEEENECSVPFLDTKVIREGTTLRTDWYTKPTYSGRYINYESYHPSSMKNNVIVNMKNKILDISHTSYKQKNLHRFYNIMKQNAYPDRLLKRLIFSTANRENPQSQRLSTQADQPQRYIPLPFVRTLSTRLAPLLRSSENDRIAYRPTKTIRNLFSKVKDRTPIMKQSNVVYNIPCTTCSTCYIGQTSRTLKDRITSHKSDVRRDTGTCALAKHVKETGHQMNYDETILDIENTFRRLFLEMVRIYQNPDAVNSKRDVDNLSSIYTVLLEVDKNKNILPFDSTQNSL